MTDESNPTALELLGKGARIEFPGGYWMKGDPRGRRIEVGTQFGSDGRRDLSEEGLADALGDLGGMALRDGSDLEGNALSAEDDEPYWPSAPGM